MRKFFLFVVCSFLVKAQNQEDIMVQEYNYSGFHNGNSKVLVSLQADMEGNSRRAITNSFVKTLVFDSYVDDARKNEVISRLKAVNPIGLYGNQNFYLKYKLDSTIVLGVYANNTDLIRSSLSADFFKVAFKGNAAYAGQTAHLTDTRISYINYQTIGFSVDKRVGPHLLGFGLSYVTVGQYQNHEIKRGLLYTAEDGTYIDLDADIRLQSSGTNANNRYFNNKGSGTALNLTYLYKSKSGKLFLAATATDLGVVTIKDIETYHKDSTYRFNGVDVGNLFEFDTEEFKKIHTDSLNEILKMKKEVKTEAKFLPFRLKLAVRYEVSSRISLLSELHYLHTWMYVPRVTFGGTYKACDRFTAFAKVSAGGLGFVDTHIGFNTLLPGKVNFYTSANLLEGLIAPSKTSGLALNVALSRIF
ncbi:MAG TPA: hypothetical protein VL947_01435 [Cytophagales bacterium]|nr:hypothetical protein [Cytophagales bacterium]